MIKIPFAKFLFWLNVLAILIVSITPGAASEAISDLDKLAHFFAFLILSFLLWSAYKLHRPFITSVLLLSAFGLSIELLQHFVPNRIFSLLDFAADIAGVVVGAFLYQLLGTKQAAV